MSHDIDCALRFFWMDNRKIKAKDTPFIFSDGADEKTIIFKYPCTKLIVNNGKFYCEVWDKKRPNFCNTYPDHLFYSCEIWNILKIQRLLDYESQFCPALKDVTVDDVINMLKEKRK